MTRRAVLQVAFLAAVLALGGLAWALFQEGVSPSQMAAMRDMGAWGPLALVAAFAIGTVLFLPGSLFGLAGGLLFGPLWGTVCNLAGATLGATLAFLFARFVAAEWVATRAGTRLKSVLDGVAAEGWRFVVLTRLVPIVPFNALNYALGLTRIRLSAYVLATAVCIIPGAAAFAWLGHAGRAAMAGDQAAIRYAAFGLGALALIAFLPRLVRRFKEEGVRFVTVEQLKRDTAAGRRPFIIDVRQREEFDGGSGHIPGAVNIPLAELPGRPALGNIAGEAVVVVCKTDKRSASAATILRQTGMKDVFVLRGGMEAWRKESTRLAAPSLASRA